MNPSYFPQQVKKKKISLQQNSPDRINLQLDKKVFQKALNKSYTKKLAQNQQVLNANQLLQTVGQFAMSILNKQIINIDKQLQQFWTIVALDQTQLNIQGIQAKKNYCSNSLTSDLKLYQLFIGLGSKQIRLQSLSNSDNYFYVNTDTVQTSYVISNLQQPSSIINIKLNVQNKYILSFFFNRSTLPFNVSNKITNQQSQVICFSIAKHTQNLLVNALLQSKGKLYKLKSIDLPDKQQFYKHLYATQQQFNKYCQTGDIILFRDNHTFAKVQRFFTNSECDHVGLVFRDQKFGLCIFQSNSGTGVSLVSWNQLIRYKWFENIQGIYWRRLDMPNRPQNFDTKVKQFVKVNIHKDYGISLGKLLSFKQIVYQNAQEQKNRTFFCSELVAALYKYLGILDQNKASSTYLPKDFTDKGSINMINNSALQRQRRLIFNENILKQRYHFYK